MTDTESQLAARVVRAFLCTGNVVLRVCDRTEARHRTYGLRIVGAHPEVQSTGPDYLVMRRGDVPIVRAQSLDEVVPLMREREGPFFLELKRTGAKPRANEVEQNRWFRIVGGA